VWVRFPQKTTSNSIEAVRLPTWLLQKKRGYPKEALYLDQIVLNETKKEETRYRQPGLLTWACGAKSDIVAFYPKLAKLTSKKVPPTISYEDYPYEIVGKSSIEEEVSRDEWV